ncbi:MAG: radical SAM protein [Pseudomonadota bacterium]
MSEISVPTVRDISFFTTYRCNSRCLNCCIWREESKPESKAEIDETQLGRLFDDPLFQRCTGIGLAGGEPTISPFFWKLLEMLPADKQVTVTTNALSSRRLITFLENCKHPEKYMIQVSVDGLAAVHDRIRGIEGSFEKAIHLLESLKLLRINRLLSFTINRLNYFQLRACYDLARELGARFSTRMAYCGGAYDNRENRDVFAYHPDELCAIDESLKKIIRGELENPEHSPAQLVFLNGITGYFKKERKALPCLAMETGLVIDPYGDVFPNCPAMMTSIGSLRNESLSTIWSGKEASMARQRISAHRCGGCWNDCQVVTNIQYQHDFLETQYLELKLDWLKDKPISDAIDFGGGHVEYLLEGWYDLERDGTFFYRWTAPRFSFLIPEGTREIEMFALVPDGGDEKIIMAAQLVLNHQRAEYELIGVAGWQKYRIDFPIPVNNMAKCQLRLNRYYCPYEKGDGADRRKLGMAVNYIRFVK